MATTPVTANLQVYVENTPLTGETAQGTIQVPTNTGPAGPIGPQAESRLLIFS